MTQDSGSCSQQFRMYLKKRGAHQSRVLVIGMNDWRQEISNPIPLCFSVAERSIKELVRPFSVKEKQRKGQWLMHSPFVELYRFQCTYRAQFYRYCMYITTWSYSSMCRDHSPIGTNRDLREQPSDLLQKPTENALSGLKPQWNYQLQL